tara:strand:+ start:447 stop:638 length:192 start_codon:yes stop_codon:yes gene_type:complete
MKDKVIQIIKREQEKHARYVPFDGMWDKAADDIIKLLEKSFRSVKNRQVIYVEKKVKKSEKKA